MNKECAAIEKVSGTVRWFNDNAGIGFILTAESPNVFIHYKDIEGQNDQRRTLYKGQEVCFTLQYGPKGPYASRLIAGKIPASADEGIAP